MQAPAQAVNHAVKSTCFIEMVFPEQANHYGTLFGGAALSLMGKAAFVAATRRARQAVVMRPRTRCDSMNRSMLENSSSSRQRSSGSAAPR